MRDVKRIDTILEKVRQLWNMYPDQRLSQLMQNYVWGRGDYFYIEDDDTERNIDFEMKSRKKQIDSRTIEGSLNKNINWYIGNDDNTLHIYGKGAMPDYPCDLYKHDKWPDFLPYMNFFNKVIISDGITSIGDDTFRDCTNIVSVTIPNSVTLIGERAFLDCRCLKSVNIPDTVETIGDFAFHTCVSLTSLDLPKSVILGKNVFGGPGINFEKLNFEKSNKNVLKIVNKSPNPFPQYATEGDSGFDIRAWIKDDYGTGESLSLRPMERVMVHTGLYMEIPQGFEVQIRPRSGLAIKQGIGIINSPATIDRFFRGEICVLLINHNKGNVVINNGDRIAQGVLCPVSSESFTTLEEIETISEDTQRGTGGFGHTGVN